MCLTTETVKLTARRQEKVKELLNQHKLLEKKWKQEQADLEKEMRVLGKKMDKLDSQYYSQEDKFVQKEAEIYAKDVIKVAEKDIVCYKEFSLSDETATHYVTPYQHFKWPKTGLVKVKKFGLSMGSRHISVAEGLHAYTQHRMENHNINTDALPKRYQRMIIPKGTKYILNERGTEVVALAMKVAPKKKNAKRRAKRS